MANDLFIELQEAINIGDTELAEEIKRKILNGCRDESIDEALVLSLKGKQIYKNMCRAITEDIDLSEHEYTKMISSLITHNIIESEITGKAISEYPINELYVVLGELLNGKVGAIDEARLFIKERYEKFLL